MLLSLKPSWSYLNSWSNLNNGSNLNTLQKPRPRVEVCQPVLAVWVGGDMKL